jgi:c-di-GMP-binding flagellar brake protein YcgR
VDISFSGTLQASTSEKGMALYQVSLPALILYRQRRASYRVRVGAGLMVPVSLDNGELPHLEGSLCDISTGGVGLRLKLDPSLEIGNGTVFSDCEIHLPENERIHSGLELCFVSPADQRNMVRFGGRFLNLEPAEQKLIEHFVVSLEREMLRKRTKE